MFSQAQNNQLTTDDTIVLYMVFYGSNTDISKSTVASIVDKINESTGFVTVDSLLRSMDVTGLLNTKAS